MSFPQPGLELAKSVISMSIEIVKVADAVSTEKGTSHGSMKSNTRARQKILLVEYQARDILP